MLQLSESTGRQLSVDSLCECGLESPALLCSHGPGARFRGHRDPRDRRATGPWLQRLFAWFADRH